MIVVTKLRGDAAPDTTYPWSKTMIYPPSRERVAAAQRAAGGWTQVRRLNGLAAGFDAAAVPTWAWAGAGLLAGAAAGYAFFKLRKG